VNAEGATLQAMGHQDAVSTPIPRGHDRTHQFPGRERRINLRLDAAEHDEIVDAAGRLGITPSGFCAESALAAARGLTPPGGLIPGTGITREELAQLQRKLFHAENLVNIAGRNLNQAVAALNATGVAPNWLELAVRRHEQTAEVLESVVEEIDNRLRRAERMPRRQRQRGVQTIHDER
jgi:hypothetical protein